MGRRHNRFVTGSLATCRDLISSGHSLSDQLSEKMKQVEAKWATLKEEVSNPKSQSMLTLLLFEGCQKETDTRRCH